MTTVSIVIPTRDRPALLARCLHAVLAQQSTTSFEVIVVNDGGAGVERVVASDERVVLVRGEGTGPAAARNAGIAKASGDVVLFTDDDAVPQPGWIDAASRALKNAPEAVGVVGRVESPPFDPLYEASVTSGDDVGNFLTCNVAYRASLLREIDGFDEGFRYPASEDRDLGYRAQAVGPVLFAADMLVVHPPRRIGAREVIRKGRYVESDWHLYAKHPQTRPQRWPLRWGPFVQQVKNWQRLVIDDDVVHGSPRRAARLVWLAGGQLLVALVTTLRSRASWGPDE